MTKASPAAPTIYQLSIERFRGIRKLSWQPGPGVNLILGGGDVGKTTILDAIGLLFSPTNTSSILDTDYNLREDEAGFVIEAIVALPMGSGINQQTKPAWPWNWNGKEALVPDHNEDGALSGEAVYRLRVCGTSELELSYEIGQPNGTTDIFPVALRRAIGLVRLSGDDRNDRDLRLVQGSALDRLLSDKGLRSRMASELAGSDVRKELGDDARTALTELDKAFKAQSLPGGLDIAVTGGQGASIASLVGLTATRETVQLPLSSWGAGTRRLSALAIAEQIQGDHPIALVDEVERGLEPYRQRLLMAKLQSGRSQAFITTHSPAAISAGSKSNLWYMDHAANVGPLAGKKIEALRESDAETFLARLAIVAEGVTEVGFSRSLLARALGSSLESHGIHVADAVGHDTAIELLEALAQGGMRFGGFADEEGRHPTRWAALALKLGPLLFRWQSGDIESNIIAAVSDAQLEQFIADPEDEKNGWRLRTLAMRLGVEDKSFLNVKTAGGATFKKTIIEAASGYVPDGTKEADRKAYKKHAQGWFKTERGGRELASKMFDMGLWPAVSGQLLPFCNAVRATAGLEPLSDIGA